MNARSHVKNDHDTVAPITNVALASGLMERLMARPDHLPGLGVFYGYSGWGKTVAANYLAQDYKAYYVQCRSIWPKSALLGAILHNMGIMPAKRNYERVDQIIEQLQLSGRPLVIDEMDHIVEKIDIELIRDIYDGSRAPIMLVGEEQFPAKLRKNERFHNRILAWQPAQPADIGDVRHLAKLYATKITIEDVLLERLLHETRGVVRRICVNIDGMREYAVARGLVKITAAEWAGRGFDGGEPPKRGG